MKIYVALQAMCLFKRKSLEQEICCISTSILKCFEQNPSKPDYLRLLIHKTALMSKAKQSCSVTGKEMKSRPQVKDLFPLKINLYLNLQTWNNMSLLSKRSSKIYSPLLIKARFTSHLYRKRLQNELCIEKQKSLSQAVIPVHVGHYNNSCHYFQAHRPLHSRCTKEDRKHL